MIYNNIFFTIKKHEKKGAVIKNKSYP